MSCQTRCDICDTKYGNWQFRKRWSIKEWFYGSMDVYFNEMDICDSCIEKFKEFVKREIK